MALPEKPVPTVNDWTKPFWQATKEGKLIVQRCGDCEKHVFYPRMRCPHCHSERLGWVEASGRATIYSHTLVEANPPSAFIADLPFVIAIVRLAEGVQMMTNIVDCDPLEVRCDMPVEVCFEKLNDECTLPKFRPIRA